MEKMVSLLLLFLFAVFGPCLSKNINTPPTPHTASHTTGRQNVRMCQDGNDYCDDDNGDDDFWWFWLFFVIAILFTSICCGVCCRMRLQRRRRLLILSGERPQSYMTYGHTEVIAPVIVVPRHQYNYHQPHLPSYTPTAENKGQPPPYS